MKEPKKPAAALLWLLLIPAQLVIDLVLTTLGAYADTAAADTANNLGHPAPGLIFLAIVMAGLFTVIISVFAVIMTIARFVKLNRIYKAYKEREKE